MTVETVDAGSEELKEVREEIRQLEKLAGSLNDAALDIQTIATGAAQYLKDEDRFVPLSPRDNLLYAISEIQRSFVVLKDVLYPRIETNTNFKEVSEILRTRKYVSAAQWAGNHVVKTNSGYCIKTQLISISSNVYGVVSSMELLLKKMEAVEILSTETTDNLIEEAAREIAARHGLEVYEKYKEPLSEALKEMWRLHGRTEQWHNIAPTWERMNKQLDIISADKLYQFSLTHYEAFEEKYDDLHTFDGDKRGFATLRGVLNKVDKFIENYKVEL